MRVLLSFLLLWSIAFAKPVAMNIGMVVSGGVSLGAYEAGYNWTLIKLLRHLATNSTKVRPHLTSLAGASAGSINALLSGIYWCQKDNITLHNSVDDNLFYDIWTGIDINNLQIKGDSSENNTSLFTRAPLEQKAKQIIEHMRRPIYRKGCSVPLGVMVTKNTPILENFDGINIKNQSFAIPMQLLESHNTLRVKNSKLHPSKDNYFSTLAIAALDSNLTKIKDILFASSAFPGAFTKVKLNYIYKNKKGSDYFLDGGVYNTIPLNIALAQDKSINNFVFIDPDSRRYYRKGVQQNSAQSYMYCKSGNFKIAPHQEQSSSSDSSETGFFGSNLLPLMHATNVFRSMKLYQTINRYFRFNPKKHLILSSRYHPLTGEFLWNFGAFLDKNFREFDYYVGVYDAIYRVAQESIKRGYSQSNILPKEMDRLVKILHFKKGSDADTTYSMFKQIEFCAKMPKQNNRFAAIYRAFDFTSTAKNRYTFRAFKKFIQKLNISNFHIQQDSFLYYAKEHPQSWYKKSAQEIIDRVILLENKKAQEDKNYLPIARALDFSAWISSGILSKKEGVEFQPLLFPESKGVATLPYKLFPSEIAFDTVNGGFSLGYSLYWYNISRLFDGVEFKLSLNSGKHKDNHLRLDIDPFVHYKAFAFGAGPSIFANLQHHKFWERKGGFGANIYTDYNDIFRFTYVRRFGNAKNRNYFYFGIRNLSSLFYWLNR